MLVDFLLLHNRVPDMTIESLKPQQPTLDLLIENLQLIDQAIKHPF